MRVRRICTIGALALTMLASGAVVAEGSPRAGTGPVPASGNANFVSACRFSHRAPDDPIVFPGQPGASHSHDFFANTTTDANSTLVSLLAGDTTCNRSEDTAAYWVPTLSRDGVAVRPIMVNAYYTPRGKKAMAPFPAGLRIIAGDSRATSPQPLMITSWSCGPNGGVRDQSSPPQCTARNFLRMHVRFPDCWDGTNLDSADHRSHMAYSRRGACPSSHRVGVPSLRLNVVYPILGGPGLSLASGGVYSGHADFFNAW
ncbi:MAG: DUF1996 domain-containing protein, partial [Actinomycetota bacterium]